MHLQEVGHLVEGRVVVADPGQAQRRRPVRARPLFRGQLREHVLQLRAGVLVEVEERGHRARQFRLRGQVLQRVLVDVERLEQRLVQELRQGFVHPAFAQRGHELLGVLLVVAQRLPKEREGHHPLPLLDEVQVRRRHAHLLRRVRLLDVPRQPQGAQLQTHVGVERVFVHRLLVKASGWKFTRFTGTGCRDLCLAGRRTVSIGPATRPTGAQAGNLGAPTHAAPRGSDGSWGHCGPYARFCPRN